jgi:hypothetical protein
VRLELEKMIHMIARMGWNMTNGKHDAATLWMVVTRKNTSAASYSHVP